MYAIRSYYGKIISGGPMMGKAIASLDVPVTKGTSGITIMPEEEAQRATMQNCIRCGRCVTVCPMGLEPYFLMTVSDKQMWDKAESNRVLDCIECGSCSYTCPADRPLLGHGHHQHGAGLHAPADIRECCGAALARPDRNNFV